MLFTKTDETSLLDNSFGAHPVNNFSKIKSVHHNFFKKNEKTLKIFEIVEIKTIGLSHVRLL